MQFKRSHFTLASVDWAADHDVAGLASYLNQHSWFVFPPKKNQQQPQSKTTTGDQEKVLPSDCGLCWESQPHMCLFGCYGKLVTPWFAFPA